MSEFAVSSRRLRPGPSQVRPVAITLAVGLHAMAMAALVWQRAPVFSVAGDTPPINVTLLAPTAGASPATPTGDTMEPSNTEPQPGATEAPSVAPVLSRPTMTPALAPAALVVGEAPSSSSASAPGAAQTGALGAPSPGPGSRMSPSGQVTASLGPQTADPYPAQVLAWVERHKRYPASASNRSLGGVTVVAVTLDRRGRVMRLTLAKSSGYALLDDAALEVFRRAEPFPRPAADAGWSRRQFEIPIEFRPGPASG